MDDIVDFNAVLDEDRLAHDSVANVVLDRELVGRVDCRAAIEGVVDAAASDLRVRSRMNVSLSKYGSKMTEI